MQEISKQELKTLIQLQRAESEIVRLEAILADVEKEKAGLAKTLTAFESGLNTQRQALEESKKLCQETELEIQVLDERIRKSNEYLRQVKTNKEYQALQREVDDNRKRKEQLETDYFQFLDTRETAETKVKDGEAELLQLSEKVSADQEKVHAQSEDDRNQMEDFIAQRDEIGKTLRPDLFQAFTEIAGSNAGLAVVEVKSEVCRGCFMNIPPQLYIEAQRCRELVLCPQCNRILYFKESVEDTAGAD